MKNVNSKEMESERSDFTIFCRHYCPEVTITEIGMQPFPDFPYTLTNVYVM